MNPENNPETTPVNNYPSAPASPPPQAPLPAASTPPVTPVPPVTPPVVPTSPPIPEPTSSPVSPDVEKPGFKKYLMWLILALIVIALAFAAWKLLFHHTSKSPTATTNSTSTTPSSASSSSSGTSSQAKMTSADLVKFSDALFNVLVDQTPRVTKADIVKLAGFEPTQCKSGAQNSTYCIWTVSSQHVYAYFNSNEQYAGYSSTAK